MDVDNSNLEENSEQLAENNIEESNATENVNDSEQINDENVKNDVKLVQLPLARIKSIMKMDPDINLTSTDAVFAVAKAAELFIDSIAKEAYSYTVKAKRKIVTKKDLDTVIDTIDCLCFLDGATDF